MDALRNILEQVEELKANQDFKRATKLLQESIVKYSDDYRLYEELADIMMYTGDYKKALSTLDFSLTLNADSATGNYLK